MKLYYAPGTCALACWIALKWAGADYEAVRADYASEEYKRINPTPWPRCLRSTSAARVP